jgi:inward rectifier potassium channel
MVFDKLKELRNSGFGSNINNEGDRLITKSGKFNVKKEGLSFFKRFNLFHSMMSMSTFSFFFFLLMAYLVLNLLFTGVYLLVGLEGLAGLQGENDALDAFFFSSQTLTTVGYGALHPTGKAIGIISSFESFFGLLGFAVSTGLLYGRFSKPKSKMMFSKNALISPYQEITGMMARVANPTNSQLINVEAKMIFSQVLSENGKMNRKFYPLELEINQISLFVTSWTIVHPISEDSPLFQLTQKHLMERNAEIVLMLSAYDESYNQEVHVRSSYKYNEMIVNAKFIPILGHNNKHQSIIKLDQLNDYEMLV